MIRIKCENCGKIGAETIDHLQDAGWVQGYTCDGCGTSIFVDREEAVQAANAARSGASPILIGSLKAR